MRKYYLLSFVLILQTFEIDSSPRRSRSITERPTLFVPVPLLDDELEQRLLHKEEPALAPINKPKINWFKHLLFILANIGKAILDRENKPQLHQHVGNIFDDVAALAQEFSTRSLTSSDRKKVISQLIEVINELAETLPAPIVSIKKM